ncbi:MAG: acetylxylan esterase [Gammaproteobacteria bacterium]
MKVRLALFWCAISFVTPLAVANELVLTPFKPGGIYELGATAGWTVTPADQEAAARTYRYTIKKNHLEVIKTGTLSFASGRASIEVVVNEPAMLYVEIDDGDATTPIQIVGAAIAPAKLAPSLPAPKDFDRFWRRKIKELRAIPANPVLTPKASGRPDVEYYTIRMDHVGGRHIHGQLAKPKRRGRFPAMAIFQWAGAPYPLEREWVTTRAAEGWIALNMQPHDVPPDQPRAYYESLPRELKEYHTIGRTDRDKSYFLQMYLANIRAVDYLASLPEWNGKTLLVTGTSMGGQQSLCAAGLHPKVTHLIVHVPAGADTHGPLYGRASGYPNWPTDDPRILETSRYFDTVNCAARIKIPSLVSMAFLDTITPPAGIFIAFNQIRGYKQAVPLIDAAHNHQATAEQQAPYTQQAEAWMRQLALGGDPAEPADKPSPRLDRNSQIAHEQLLRKKSQGKIDVYFLGDSITRRWGAADPQYKHLLANWNKNFFGWNAANFGWGADKTQNILWRLENGELDGVHPKIIVLMAGTNNVGNLTPIDDDRQRIEEITRGLKAIIDACRKKAPQATIVLTGITPRNDNIAVMPTIRAINANLAKLADGKRIRYIDLSDKLADEHGRLFEGMTDPDQLHLSEKAYQIWADELKPIFTEILGPPASTDHAPPPTGDPSVMGSLENRE